MSNNYPIPYHPTWEANWELNRLLLKVDTTEPGKCWEWQATLTHCGYGSFKYDGRMREAHRVAWRLLVGEIPEGMLVLHKCNNKRCINPNHLYLGDYHDNAMDRAKDGWVPGPSLARKLYDEEVWLIRRILSKKVSRGTRTDLGGISQGTVAKMFRVSRRTIRNVLSNSNFQSKGSANA